MSLTFMLSTLADTLRPGEHTLRDRKFVVSLPSILPSLVPTPVMICLHGNGGDGQQMVHRVADSIPELAQHYIIIGPDGTKRSWNVKGEYSTEDDQRFIGRTLLAHLASFENVQPTFVLFGFSNGAALVNRIMIENDDARITHSITVSSQLNAYQYRDGNFYVGGEDNTYTEIKRRLTRRHGERRSDPKRARQSRHACCLAAHLC